jgi:protein-serine/threonine kinase
VISNLNFDLRDPSNMTQLFASSPSAVTNNEKRGNFPALSLPSRKHSNESGHLPTRIKNFFRINSSSSHSSANTNGSGSNERERERERDVHGSAKNEKSAFRQSRFLPGIGRNRSTTVASEGNPLDDAMSPTASANPYFAHQGQPALRHRNDGSVPSSPPDTPELQVTGVSAAEQATTANKEELARKLRRVASAPNAQGLFSGGQGDRPQTADLGKEPLVQQSGGSLGLADSVGEETTLAVPSLADNASFRRTYSSSSIKVRNVEVGPASFDKIKLIGKGDVGKVYLVREKKSSRLYAMKGTFCHKFVTCFQIYVLTCG